MGGDGVYDERTLELLCLNPPRPHGRGLMDQYLDEAYPMLKSTPPAWAGTQAEKAANRARELKSTPPAWAGTEIRAVSLQALQLKSTPPAWAGTSCRRTTSRTPRLKSTPPAWAGTGRVAGSDERQGA